ncbi:flagellar hook-length control protein FliK [Labrenzia sp. R4_1]|uniref:flagellar hook-length control protein FliK n=1 Tax=Labrenzia sp. R4_1 TaxID=2821106 RepID=UPI001ADCFBC5|nr:flagellar hook-length control protein FliK [Labrenzia sp. R4_1]MBO9424496.1 flagellar hook-length control protein FliK [Labrenzia sp. R4_1]
MVETVSAQPLPANTQGGTAPQALEPGTELRAKVEANLPGGVVRLSSDAKSIDLRVPSPLPVGSNVTLSVSGTRQQPAVVLTPDSSAAKPVTPAPPQNTGQSVATQPTAANTQTPASQPAASGPPPQANPQVPQQTQQPTQQLPQQPAQQTGQQLPQQAPPPTGQPSGQPQPVQPTLPRPAPVLAQFLQATGVLPQSTQPGGAVQPQLPGQILTQPAAPGQPAVPNQAQVPGQLPASAVLPQPGQPAPPSGSGQAPLPAQGAGTGGPIAGAPIISTGQGTVVPPLPSGGPAPGTPGAPVSAQSGPQTTVSVPSGTGGPTPSQGAGGPLPGGLVSGTQVSGQQVSGPQASGPLQAGATSPTQVPPGGSMLAAAPAGTPLPAAGATPLQSPGTGPIPTAPVTPQTGQPLPAGLPAGAPTGTGAPGVPPASGQPATGQAIQQTGAFPASVTSASGQTPPAQGAPGAAPGAQASVAPPASALPPQGAPPGGVISQTVSVAGQGAAVGAAAVPPSAAGGPQSALQPGGQALPQPAVNQTVVTARPSSTPAAGTAGQNANVQAGPPPPVSASVQSQAQAYVSAKPGMATPGQPASASQGSRSAASTPVQQAAAALRQPLAEQQASLGNLFAQIGSLMSAQAAGKASVPDAVQKAMQQILGLRLNSGQQITGQSLQQAVRLSGQGGEGRLPLPAGAQQSPVPDLKTALLAFRGLLQSLGAEPAVRFPARQPAPASRSSGPQGQAPQTSSGYWAGSAPQNLQSLLQETDAALARMRLTQLTNAGLAGDDGPQAAAAKPMDTVLELPLALGQDTAVMQMQIGRDGGGNSADEDEEPAWRLRFALDLTATGPLEAAVSLRGGGTYISLWVDRKETLDLLAGLQETMEAAFADAGLDLQELRFIRGLPPKTAAKYGALINRQS